jgi:hypothetical protein
VTDDEQESTRMRTVDTPSVVSLHPSAFFVFVAFVLRCGSPMGRDHSLSLNSQEDSDDNGV